jgi:hypothetical protein
VTPKVGKRVTGDNHNPAKGDVQLGETNWRISIGNENRTLNVTVAD